MKKSERYYMAQIAIINAPCISPERKLEILRTLFADEDAEKYWEERDEKRSIENVQKEIAENQTLEVF